MMTHLGDLRFRPLTLHGLFQSKLGKTIQMKTNFFMYTNMIMTSVFRTPLHYHTILAPNLSDF